MQTSNSYILVSIIDREGNLLLNTEDAITKLTQIDEHDERVKELSKDCKFVMDRTYYNIFGKIPGHFTYVIDDNLEKSEQLEKFCIAHPRKNFDRLIQRHEAYKTENLFFCGTSNFLTFIKNYLTTVMLTVVDHDFSKEFEIYDQFPIQEYSTVFTNKQVFKSDVAEITKNTSMGHAPSTREVTILNDYFKLVEKKAKPKRTSEYYYKFVNFTK